MKNLTFWTGNPNKLSEASGILWVELLGYTEEDLLKISELPEGDIPEVQSMDIRLIVKEKAKAVYEVLWRPVIVEDTGLFIKSLSGFPWPFVKYTLEQIGNKWILKLMEWISDRTILAVTWVCVYDWKKYISWYGEIEWVVTNQERKWEWKVFWYDPIFQPVGSEKTFAEMSWEEKNKISMRKLAFEDFIKNYNTL